MADQESDGVNEAFGSALRVVGTAAALTAEQAARTREQAARDAQAAADYNTRQARERAKADLAAARAALAPVWRREWWDGARAEHIAEVWETAQTWSERDVAARRAGERIRDEVLRRYEVDLTAPGADSATLAKAVRRQEKREAFRERNQAMNDKGLKEHQESVDRERRDAQGARYDSTERRRAMGEDLRRRGVDAETAEARVTADANQGRPAEDAVHAAPGRPPAARRARPRRGREQQRQPVQSR